MEDGRYICRVEYSRVCNTSQTGNMRDDEMDLKKTMCGLHVLDYVDRVSELLSGQYS